MHFYSNFAQTVIKFTSCCIDSWPPGQQGITRGRISQLHIFVGGKKSPLDVERLESSGSTIVNQKNRKCTLGDAAIGRIRPVIASVKRVIQMIQDLQLGIPAAALQVNS